MYALPVIRWSVLVCHCWVFFRCLHGRCGTFPLQADGEVLVINLCAVFSLWRLWLPSLPPCHTAPRVGSRRRGGLSVSWAAIAAARWCSRGTRQWALEGLKQKWRRSGWGPANDWSTLAVLRSAAGGVGGWWSLRFWSRDLRKPVYSGRGGRAGLPHKNACVMTGAAKRRNALHNPNTVGARPGLMWQPFLIYFSSFCPHSPALSVARNIPGKNVKLHFYLWLRVPCSQRRLFQRGWNVTEKLRLSSNDLFIYYNIYPRGADEDFIESGGLCNQIIYITLTRNKQR